MVNHYSITMRNISQAMKNLFQPVFLHGNCSPLGVGDASLSPNTEGNDSIQVFTDGQDQQIFAEDVVAVSDVQVRIQCDDEIEDERKNKSDNKDSDSDSEETNEKGFISVGNGLFSSFLCGPSNTLSDGGVCQCANGGEAMCKCETFLLWRMQNESGVKWYAALLDMNNLPGGFCWHNTCVWKSYISNSTGSAAVEGRSSLIACLKSASDPRSHCIVKVNVLDVIYSDITEIVNSGDRNRLIMSYLCRNLTKMSPPEMRSKILQLSGNINDILCSSPRGVVGLLSLSGAGFLSSGEPIAESVVIIDVEDEGDDDGSSEDEEGGEGGNETDDDMEL